MVNFTVSEWHQVTSNKMYEVDDEQVAEEFGSVERFIEIMSHQEQQMFGGMEPQGEEPTDEEHDLFWDFVNESDYEREDDWWMDRKGGYEVTVKLDDE
jgi:hypothetical protein